MDFQKHVKKVMFHFIYGVHRPEKLIVDTDIKKLNQTNLSNLESYNTV